LSFDDAILALSTDALRFVKDGYVIGLGSGRAATAFVKSLAKLLHEKNIKIRGVPTSLQIKIIAEQGGIHLIEADQVDKIDVVFDGA
jgi:ribose 5-phosphate isomerase A